MSTDNRKPSFQKSIQKFLTPLEKAFKEEEERIAHRQEELARTQYGEETTGGDKQLASSQQHNYTDDVAAKKKNFDEKIYMFPESFNALRKELTDHWPVFFSSVKPGQEMSVAYAMVYDAPTFIGMMNDALDMQVQMDSDNVSEICHTFLNGLRKLRGLSAIN
jgi:hypothetical protein